MRDHQGKFVFAYSISMGQGTSNLAEAEAMLFGLKWCANKGIPTIIGETESMLLAKCIKGK